MVLNRITNRQSHILDRLSDNVRDGTTAHADGPELLQPVDVPATLGLS